MTARPVAVLADDTASAGRVRALLPGAGLVVATSRYELANLITPGGARLIRLGPLEAVAAAELTARIIGRPRPDQAALAELARYCGHLPLAEDHPLSLAETLTVLAQDHARIGGTEQALAFLDQARARHEHLHLPGSHPARAQTAALAGQLTAQAALQPPDGTPSQPSAPGPCHPGTPDA